MAKRLAELWSCSIFSSFAPRRARACFQPCLAASLVLSPAVLLQAAALLGPERQTPRETV